jgi:acid phosphatase type 7
MRRLLACIVAAGVGLLAMAPGSSARSLGTVSADPVIAAAGDICGTPTDCVPTAAVVKAINPTRVLTLGDSDQTQGTLTEFREHYAPSWGAFLGKTDPAPGNHEYLTGGTGYFAYFGARAPAPYYSFNLGSWHLISLDSEIAVGAGTAQERWFQADLAAHPNLCTLVYWHKPRWSSGHFGPITKMDPLWRDAAASGVDVVLSGHDHIYERFGPQSGTGALDPAHGVRQFVVGTGGYNHGGIVTVQPHSEVRNSGSFGVLKLTLHPSSYEWSFVPAAGATFTDAGSTLCH